jgi:hypothetical protein
MASRNVLNNYMNIAERHCFEGICIKGFLVLAYSRYSSCLETF